MLEQFIVEKLGETISIALLAIFIYFAIALGAIVFSAFLYWLSSKF